MTLAHCVRPEPALARLAALLPNLVAVRTDICQQQLGHGWRDCKSYGLEYLTGRATKQTLQSELLVRAPSGKLQERYAGKVLRVAGNDADIASAVEEALLGLAGLNDVGHWLVKPPSVAGNPIPQLAEHVRGRLRDALPRVECIVVDRRKRDSGAGVRQYLRFEYLDRQLAAVNWQVLYAHAADHALQPEDNRYLALNEKRFASWATQVGVTPDTLTQVVFDLFPLVQCLQVGSIELATE